MCLLTWQTIRRRESGLLVIETLRAKRTEMEYPESDLSMASYLLARGFKLLGLELVGTRYSFKFEDGGLGAPQDAVSAIQEYRNGALISALAKIAGKNRQYAKRVQLHKSRNRANLFAVNRAPVAQLDRALVSGTRGRAFKSPQARHIFQSLS